MRCPEFAHLGLSVGAGQAGAGLVFGDQCFRLHQGRPIGLVESAHNFPGLLQHGQLIVAHRHGGGPECGDIGGLADRVGQKARWNAGLKIPLLNFGLDGGVALQPGHGDQIQVEEGQLRQLRHLRLNKQVGFRRIQPAGEVIQGHLQNVFPDFVGMVGICR